MAKVRRRWMAVDVDFTTDEKVLDAGWAAAELYLAVLGLLTRSDSTDGRISRQQVLRLGISKAIPKADRLVKAGLWDELDPDTYVVRAWIGWHSEAESTARTREWRARQASRRDVT